MLLEANLCVQISQCLGFVPHQMLMQYLYYGGTESMEIPTANILEVSICSLSAFGLVMHEFCIMLMTDLTMELVLCKHIYTGLLDKH